MLMSKFGFAAFEMLRWWEAQVVHSGQVKMWCGVQQKKWETQGLDLRAIWQISVSLSCQSKQEREISKNRGVGIKLWRTLQLLRGGYRSQQ